MFQRECAFFTTDFADSFAQSVSILKRLCTDCEVVAFNLSARSTVGLLLFSHEYSSLPVRVIDREIGKSLV